MVRFIRVTEHTQTGLLGIDNVIAHLINVDWIVMVTEANAVIEQDKDRPLADARWYHAEIWLDGVEHEMQAIETIADILAQLGAA